MKKNKIIWSLVFATATFTAHAVIVEWDKIMHWTGEGSKKAALVVQFNDGGPQEAYVWGFRWNDSDYENDTLTGEKMFRAIAKNSDDLLLFTQYTGGLGSTVDGIGYYNPSEEHISNVIAFNYDSAKNDKWISFDYVSPNELMGQKNAPGMFTPIYCKRAIQESLTTNIIEHPINYRVYGYPAYDYDWWQPTVVLDKQNQRWNAGWYRGYWSYWVGGEDLEDASYSGLGYSSRVISDGQVDAWKFAFLNGPVDGSVDGATGASEPWQKINYHHFLTVSSVDDVKEDARAEIEAIYTVGGIKVASGDNLMPGLYIIKYRNGKTRKLAVK